MKRRAFVCQGVSGLALAGLAGCRLLAEQQLDVRFLEQSLPLSVIRAFRADYRGAQLGFEAAPQLADLYAALQRWQSDTPPQPPLWRRWLPAQPPARSPDLVTLGDSWLQTAIEQALIRPLPVDSLPGWAALAPQWQQLVWRNEQGSPSANGNLWAAPYRVQTLAIAYRSRAVQQLGHAPTAWADLWQPELRGKIALPNSPRLVLSLALKRLGASINDVAAFPRAERALADLLQQARVFDSSASLKALINEDIWVAVAWSSDILASLLRYRQLQASLPQEGSVFSADLWVQPKAAHPATELVTDWISFCWQPATALQISLSSRGIAPQLLGADRPESLQSQPLLPSPEQVANSEPLLPLTAAGQTALEDVFKAARG